MVDKLGESMDECDVLLKNHEAFERLIGSQEDKVRPTDLISYHVPIVEHFVIIWLDSRYPKCARMPIAFAEIDTLKPITFEPGRWHLWRGGRNSKKPQSIDDTSLKTAASTIFSCRT